MWSRLLSITSPVHQFTIQSALAVKSLKLNRGLHLYIRSQVVFVSFFQNTGMDNSIIGEVNILCSSSIPLTIWRIYIQLKRYVFRKKFLIPRSKNSNPSVTKIVIFCWLPTPETLIFWRVSVRLSTLWNRTKCPFVK